MVEPRLSRKGGGGGLRSNLSHAWDRAVREIPSRLSRTPSTSVRENNTPAQLHIDQPSTRRLPEEAGC